MTRAEAKAEAQRRWGPSFGDVRVSRMIRKLAPNCEGLTEYLVGEWGPGTQRSRVPRFEVRGKSLLGWADAFRAADGLPPIEEPR